MPLEALAALGLANSIIQFVDFLCNLFAETREIRNSPLRQNEFELREEDMRRRLDGRTKGLLESSSRQSSSDIPTVDFLHRTVRDFLLTGNMLPSLIEHRDVDFDANECLWKAFLAQMKLGPLPKSRDSLLDPLETVLYYAHEIELSSGKHANTALDQVEKVVATKPGSRWAGKIQQDGCFLGHAISNNLHLYVAEKLAGSQHMSVKSSLSMLHVYLRAATNLSTNPTQRYLNPNVVKLLLSKGADPNESLNFVSTVWTEFLTAMHKSRSLFADRAALVETIALLISHGADLDIPVQIGTLKHKSLDSGSHQDASEVIKHHFKKEAAWLLSKSPSQAPYFNRNPFSWLFFR